MGRIRNHWERYWIHYVLLAPLAASLIAAAACRRMPADGRSTLPAAVPVAAPAGSVPPAGTVKLSGSPEEIGAGHGRLLGPEIRTMVDGYVRGSAAWGDERLRADLLEKTRRMKETLPGWYVRELKACAGAAGVDEDELLYAQCEGDIRQLCTAYAAFGAGTHDGEMEIGRNFDYFGFAGMERCATVTAVTPERGDGHAFVVVGWAGILGGWTYYNEEGLFVANNLGGPPGGYATNAEGIPTLILERIIAQKAGTTGEAVEMLKTLPRMRNQTLLLAQCAKGGRGAEAVVVEYDAKRVAVKKPEGGLAFDTSIGSDERLIRRILKDAGRRPEEAIKSAGNMLTLHSVVVRPGEGAMWVAQGRQAHTGDYRKYDLGELLGR
ncbi:MAG: hypothetical protein JW909_01215 [Planctomycetes bacterium]|nr:hypothetical protein [Planctomycetota bacterium]